MSFSKYFLFSVILEQTASIGILLVNNHEHKDFFNDHELESKIGVRIV